MLKLGAGLCLGCKDVNEFVDKATEETLGKGRKKEVILMNEYK